MKGTQEDELDRVTFVDYPDATLDTTYTYGTSPALFEVGRLGGITRDSHTVAYSYDRFGRTTQDGDLTLGYDKNGNRSSIGYPGGVTADYTFDYADRERSLAVTTPAGTTDVVTSATYLPSGPLATLTFGTGAWEDRAFTSRYLPDSIVLTASRGRTWTYDTDGAGGNTAQLSSIALSTLGTRDYTYTPAGHVEDVTAGANVVDFTWDDAGRLAASDRSTDTAAFLYDGRSFLRQAGDAAGPGLVLPTYDSSGLQHCLQRQLPTGTTDYHVFYLAGRPVGQVALESGQPERWWYFTTDHLGTPVVATDSNQDELWVNRFDPFGEDPLAGTQNGASEQGVFLRFPGQWDDPVWRDAMMGAEGYHNVWRWYAPGSGRFSRPDPWGTDQPNGIANLHSYAESSPTVFTDPQGLIATSVLGPLFDSAFDCFYCLLARSNFGITPYEQCGWLEISSSLTYECDICQPVRQFAKCKCPARPPGSTLVHTHPTRSRTSRTGRLPSEADKDVARSRGVNVITVNPEGVWVFGPDSLRPQRIAPKNWWKRPGGPTDRNCEPCEGISQP